MNVSKAAHDCVLRSLVRGGLNKKAPEGSESTYDELSYEREAQNKTTSTIKPIITKK
jgi:hypothetical protein